MGTMRVMSGQDNLDLRKARLAASPAWLRGGFRPFFLGAGIWALAALLLWLTSVEGWAPLKLGGDPLAWHRHEMLFGFVGAAICGFLLTAIPNWTGRLPIAGWPLALLFAGWIAGRIVGLTDAPWQLKAVVDTGFYLIFAGVAGREVILAKNRNLPIVLAVTALGVAAAIDRAGAAGDLANPDLGWEATIALVATLISLIGGRIIPSFTRNWLQQRGVTSGLPVQPGRFDKGLVLATLIAMTVWAAGVDAKLTFALLALVAVGHLVRVVRWSGWRTATEPLLLVLHIAYLWLPVGTALLALAAIGIVPRSAGVHALTAGLMGTMVLAVMSRAIRGHTGRALHADANSTVMFGAITLAALLRVCTALGDIDAASGWAWSGALWIVAFTQFLIGYAPMLLRARPDGKL